MKSLFLVNSPLEMISAIEAREHFNISKTKLLLYISDTDRKIIQFLLNESGKWSDIKWISRKSYYGLSWILLIKKLKKQKYHYFFSPMGSLTGHFLFNLQFNHHFFLDDGTQTLTLVDYYKKNKDFSKKMSLFEGKNKYGFKYNLIELLHNLFNHKFRGEHIVPNFFTFFDIEKSEEQIVVKNNFNWFRSLSNKKNDFVKIHDTIYIIGTALVTDKYFSIEYYISVLQKMKTHYKNKKLIYIFHRRETKDQLQQIKNQVNIDIQKNKYLIEIDFFMENIIPTHIVGTISTALFTLKKLYGNAINIDTFSLDMNETTDAKKDILQSVLEVQNQYVDNRY